MASTASGSESSSASSSSQENVAGEALVSQAMMEQRPQAGPLPVKTPRLVGEIGYAEESARLQNTILPNRPNTGDSSESVAGLSVDEADANDGRHPAERSQTNLASSSTTTTPPDASSSAGVTQPNPNDSTTSLNTTSKHSLFSIHSLSSRLSTKEIAGVTLTTLTRLFLLICTLCGLIVAWVFTTLSLVKKPLPSPTMPQTNGSSAIFVHVAFTIITLLMLVFIERAIFQLRAERYAHVHPGQTLPSHRHHLGAERSNGRPNGMAFAPWNRPPLPTYAAALGVRGTGDVEDAIIAAPPPPAYGNTRGSTLILASFLRNSLRSSMRGSPTTANNPHPRPGGRLSGLSTMSAPVSYDEVEHQSDIERARILEQALAKLEEADHTS